MKSKVDKLDVNKLVPALVDLSKLSNVVKNDVVKKDVYNAKIKNIEDKIPDNTNLATKTTPNAKIYEVKGEIPSVSNSVKKLTITQNLMKLKRKLQIIIMINILLLPEFNKFTAEIFALRLKRESLARKRDIANFINKTDFDDKLKDVTSNKNELKEL